MGLRDFVRFYYMVVMVERVCMFENKFVFRCFKVCGFCIVINVRLYYLLDVLKDGYGVVWYLRIVNDKGVLYCLFVLGKICVIFLKVVFILYFELVVVVVVVKFSCLIWNELEYFKYDKIYGIDFIEVL